MEMQKAWLNGNAESLESAHRQSLSGDRCGLSALK